jgi:hypothetical protein
MTLRRFASILATVGLVLALNAGAASAIKLHPTPVGEPIGKDGTPAGEAFGLVEGVAFQQAEKRLYAFENSIEAAPTTPDKLYGFDASTPGSYSPLAAFGPLLTSAFGRFTSLAVDNSTLASAGNIYLKINSTVTGNPFPNEYDETTKIFGFSANGEALPGWPVVLSGNQYGNIAVDPTTGNIWLAQANFHKGQFVRFTPSGTTLPSVSTEPFGGPNAMAFDSNGDLYTFLNNNAGSAAIYRLTAPNYDQPEVILTNVSGQLQLQVDGATHDFYVGDHDGIRRYGHDGTLLETFATNGASVEQPFAIDQSTGDIIRASGQGPLRRFPGLEFPLATTGSATDPGETSLTLNGTVRPDGVTLTDCHFEYVSEAAFEASGFSDLSSGGSLPCAPAFGSIPADSVKHPVSAAATGLDPNTSYRFRLVAANANGANPGQSSIFQPGKPFLETAGSPLRTTTTARLEGRVDPHGLPTSYHFEYGDQGPCDANPCETTETHSTGSAGTYQFVSEAIKGLQPGTVYHYRVVAENGHPAGPATGEDMTLTTRTSDALSHGHFPGPPGSDRAWEQVNIPDTGGNPVLGALAVSDNGERAFYRVAGGTPISSTGTTFSPLYAERTPSGWRSSDIFPPRDQLIATSWLQPVGPADLSNQVVLNFDNTTGAMSIWRLRPGQSAVKVFQPLTTGQDGPVIVSEDASRVVIRHKGSLDPAHPVGSTRNLYDVTTGTPQLIDLMPDGSVPACGAEAAGRFDFPVGGTGNVSRASHWLSADGTFAFFPSSGSNCSSQPQLYVREIEAEQTKLISGPPISGPSCGAAFLKSNSEAAFFWTQTRLDPTDTDPGACSNGNADGDVYRYDLGDGALQCVTCTAAGDANVNIGSVPSNEIAVAADGSRVYFSSEKVLVPGAAAPGVYRVNVASGALAYVAPGNTVGENRLLGRAITPDGSVVVFASLSAELNAINGLQNGGTTQFYRYDDNDRSLVCLSCPLDGSLPTSAVHLSSFVAEGFGNAEPAGEAGANKTALAADGETFAFSTATPLVGADQNTARTGEETSVGTDVYEWRDGRQLLVSDGLTRWPDDEKPVPSAITPSGRDLFFTAPAQYTADAIDGFRRLYDARIGGGIEFPAAPKPCPLEVCQGTPKGAPEEPTPGTSSFQAPGNPAKKAKGCPKGRVRKHGRCGVKSHKGKAKSHRRAAGPNRGSAR